MRVVELWRYPMKSAGGERLDAAEVTADGLVGDRRWACIDDDGVVVSAKQPRLWERLLQVTVAGGTVRLPDGRTASLETAITDTATSDTATSDTATSGAAGSHTAASGTAASGTAAASSARAASSADGATVGGALADAGVLLSGWLGRRVTVTDVVPDGAVLHRFWPREPGMIPTWAAGAEAGGDVLSVIGSGRFHDFGAVHVVTTGALARLGEVHGAGVDHRRFRPNLLLDLPGDPAPGDVVRVGGVRLRVLVPTPRCVVPSLGHGGGAGDAGLLRTLARHYRMPVGDFGTAACFGWYAAVDEPGRIEAGQAGRS